MKLIKAHIINFGRFHDFDIDFDKPLNSFVFENGWGKTTLSVFIKSMFYGMEHTAKRKIEENELKKYTPWQGGICGGNLTFSYEGKEYRVSRTFALDKNEKDTAEILDLQTNKIIEIENLGVFLFKVNRETYERTLHVTLDESPSGSDDISAKLNNLLEAADMQSFDKACSVLEIKATLLKKRGGGGEIAEIQNKIESDREKLSEIDARISQNEEYEKKVAAIENENSLLKEKQDFFGEQLSLCAKFESKARYEQLKEDAKSAETSRDSLLDFFYGDLPDTDVIKTIDSILSEYTTVQSNLKNNSATQAEKDQYKVLQEYFAGDIPTKDLIDSCIKTDEEYKLFCRRESEKKLTENENHELIPLKQKFDGKDISSEKIKDCIASFSEIQNIKLEEGKLSEKLHAKQLDFQVQHQTRQKNTKRIIFFVIAAIGLVAAAALFFILKNMIIAACPLAAFIIFTLLGIISKTPVPDCSALLAEISNLQKQISNLEETCSEKADKITTFVSQFGIESGSDLVALNKLSIDYDRFKMLVNKQTAFENWLNTQSGSAAEYEQSLKAFVKRFCKTEDISSVPSEIQILNDKLKRLSELENKINSDSRNSELQKEATEKLEKILSQYKTQKALSFAEQVQELHDKINDIKNASDNIGIAAQRLKEFEEDPKNDIGSFASLVKPEKSADDLRSGLSMVADKITEKNAEIAGYRKIINDNLAYTERKEELETEVERLLQKKKEKTEEHGILLTTRELLSKAKENLDAKFSDPMKKGFAKYLKMLGGKQNLVIDTDLKVSEDAEGKLRESGYLSAGYKDIVNFCSRMALIDALFTGEKPPVILDDPFVNFDDDKMPAALKLVKDMSEEKQIIYFTCHKSREVTEN